MWAGWLQGWLSPEYLPARHKQDRQDRKADDGDDRQVNWSAGTINHSADAAVSTSSEEAAPSDTEAARRGFLVFAELFFAALRGLEEAAAGAGSW